MSYDNSKQVILSKVVSDKPNAPALRVNFEISGQKMKASLWPWTKKDGTPVTDKNGNMKYKGDYEVDDYEPQQQQQPQAEQYPEAGDIDDSIPF